MTGYILGCNFTCSATPDDDLVELVLGIDIRVLVQHDIASVSCGSPVPEEQDCARLVEIVDPFPRLCVESKIVSALFRPLETRPSEVDGRPRAGGKEINQRRALCWQMDRDTNEMLNALAVMARKIGMRTRLI